MTKGFYPLSTVTNLTTQADQQIEGTPVCETSPHDEVDIELLSEEE